MTTYTASWLEYHAPRDEQGEVIYDASDDWFVKAGYPHCFASHNDGQGDGWHELECSAVFQADTLKSAQEWIQENVDAPDMVYVLLDDQGNEYTDASEVTETKVTL